MGAPHGRGCGCWYLTVPACPLCPRGWQEGPVAVFTVKQLFAYTDFTGFMFRIKSREMKVRPKGASTKKSGGSGLGPCCHPCGWSRGPAWSPCFMRRLLGGFVTVAGLVPVFASRAASPTFAAHAGGSQEPGASPHVFWFYRVFLLLMFGCLYYAHLHRSLRSLCTVPKQEATRGTFTRTDV